MRLRLGPLQVAWRQGMQPGEWECLLAALELLRIGQENIMAVLDGLRAQVEAATAVEQSAVTLIQGLAVQVQTLADKLAQGIDPATVQAEAQGLADELKTTTDALSAAIVANTPSQP